MSLVFSHRNQLSYTPDICSKYIITLYILYYIIILLYYDDPHLINILLAVLRLKKKEKEEKKKKKGIVRDTTSLRGEGRQKMYWSEISQAVPACPSCHSRPEAKERRRECSSEQYL